MGVLYEANNKMINGIRVIGLIPVRGGSKSIPNKNQQLLGGKPLMVWPIESGLKTPEIDRVIISSDDPSLCEIGAKNGAETYLRPQELATDTSLVVDVIRDFWTRVSDEGESAKILVLLEATSPFRTPELISRCLERLVNENLDSIATFKQAAVNPERTWKIIDKKPSPFIEGAIPWKPRQLLRDAYQLDGAVYAFYPDRLPKNAPSLLFGNAGGEFSLDDMVVDIDTPVDLEIANAILRLRR